jgi:hypothetical protein
MVTELVNIFQYIFFLNLEVIQLKLLKDLVQISLPAFASPMLISEEEKTNARKLACFLLTYAQLLTAAHITVTYNDKGGREKRESYGRY